MRIPTWIHLVVCANATLATLAGCSGAAAFAPTPASQSGGMLSLQLSAQQSVVQNAGLDRSSVLPPRMHLGPAHSVAGPGYVTNDAQVSADIFVSDSTSNVVAIYNAGSGKMVGQLTGFNFPQGLTTDRSGKLYVADTKHAAIKIYTPPYRKSATTTIADPGQFPAGVSVSKSGVLAVTNIVSKNGGPGSVNFYAAGATTPCNTVSEPATFARVFFDAFDDRGTLFVDGLDSNDVTHVAEITGGCGATRFTDLTTTNTIGFPGGVQVDTSDRIAIEDQNIGPAIDIYTPPVGHALGTPVAALLSGTGDPVTFALTSTASELYTADTGNHNVAAYAYPAGGSPVKKIAIAGTPVGIALTPAERP